MRERPEDPRPSSPRTERSRRERLRPRAITAALAALTLLLGGMALATASGGDTDSGSLVGNFGTQKPGDGGKGGDDGNGEDQDDPGAPDDQDPGEGGEDDHDGGDHGDHGEDAVPGPNPEDFAPIEEAPARDAGPEAGAEASTGSLTIDCGTNETGVFNSENVIVSPGVEHGAQHIHDYVGNQDVQNFTEDVATNNEILAAGETTCTDGDRSMHFWPVLRDITAEGEDAGEPGGGLDGNVGSVLAPSAVIIEFVGNPSGPVVEMPEFLQVITGNARAATSEGVNAAAQWTCTGFEDVAFPDRYPLCPEGSDVVRIFDFPGCWNGRDFESEDSRSHTAFAQEDGACQEGFTAIPQLRHTLVYEVPEGPNFAVDSFPEQGRAPITDHSDHINVMPAELMARTVECINTGQDC